MGYNTTEPGEVVPYTDDTPLTDYDATWMTLAEWEDCLQLCLQPETGEELANMADFHERVAKANTLAPADSCSFQMVPFRLMVAERIREEIKRRKGEGDISEAG